MSDITDEHQTADTAAHCKHFVKRKKRYCKMTLKSGYEYCGEHLPPESDSTGHLRVACPLDSKHTCFAHNLQKHLKVCNARPPVQPYISKGVNCGTTFPDPNSATIINSRQLSTVKIETLKNIIDKVQKVYAEHIEGHIVDEHFKHKLLDAELQNPEYGDKTKKHLWQNSAILGILESKQLLQNDTCFIEFGAGKGQLSFWMAQAIKELQHSSVLLVERASHRHKYDNKVDKSENSIHRIKVDIGDLLLDKVDIIAASKIIVGVTKHLCGDATDLAIRCLENFERTGGHVGGAVMAFCCHHRCQWSSFVGQEFFKKCGLTQGDFDAMCGMVSWAICGTGLGRDKTHITTLEPNQRDKELGITREEKEVIGRKCKNILNYGRLHYLQELGYDCMLSRYVSESVSPENVCLIAKKKKDT